MEVDHRVRSYACAVADCSLDQITAVTRFESGERHAVYKVSYVAAGVTNHRVIRISNSHDARDVARAEREAMVLERVQGVAAPLLYDFRRESPWFDGPTMCMQFVPGQQRELAAAAPTEVERLGSVVGSIHGLPIDDLVKWFPEVTTIAAYREGRVQAEVDKLPSVRDPLPASVQRRLRRAWHVVNESLERSRRAESFGTDEGLALLHGDIATGNILWAPRPVLIDWEYARLGDPADEVAYIFTQNGLAEPQRRAFWRGYRRSVEGQQRLEDVVDRVDWWEPVTLLGSVLWWIERWSRRADADAVGDLDPSAPRTQGYYLDHALRRLDRLDELLNATGGPRVL